MRKYGEICVRWQNVQKDPNKKTFWKVLVLVKMGMINELFTHFAEDTTTPQYQSTHVWAVID